MKKFLLSSCIFGLLLASCEKEKISVYRFDAGSYTKKSDPVIKDTTAIKDTTPIRNNKSTVEVFSEGFMGIMDHTLTGPSFGKKIVLGHSPDGKSFKYTFVKGDAISIQTGDFKEPCRVEIFVDGKSVAKVTNDNYNTWPTRGVWGSALIYWEKK